MPRATQISMENGKDWHYFWNFISAFPFKQVTINSLFNSIFVDYTCVPAMLCVHCEKGKNCILFIEKHRWTKKSRVEHTLSNLVYTHNKQARKNLLNIFESNGKFTHIQLVSSTIFRLLFHYLWVNLCRANETEKKKNVFFVTAAWELSYTSKCVSQCGFSMFSYLCVHRLIVNDHNYERILSCRCVLNISRYYSQRMGWMCNFFFINNNKTRI